ncbi:MAG TPA: hypothetical protein VGF17_05645, partial [Phytomonospora sp.]
MDAASEPGDRGRPDDAERPFPSLADSKRRSRRGAPIPVPREEAAEPPAAPAPAPWPPAPPAAPDPYVAVAPPASTAPWEQSSPPVPEVYPEPPTVPVALPQPAAQPYTPPPPDPHVQPQAPYVPPAPAPYVQPAARAHVPQTPAAPVVEEPVPPRVPYLVPLSPQPYPDAYAPQVSPAPPPFQHAPVPVSPAPPPPVQRKRRGHGMWRYAPIPAALLLAVGIVWGAIALRGSPSDGGAVPAPTGSDSAPAAPAALGSGPYTITYAASGLCVGEGPERGNAVKSVLVQSDCATAGPPMRLL